jgi:hypothetical protein
LFNVEKYNNENKNKSNTKTLAKDHPHIEDFDMLLATVDTVLDRSKFDKVDLSALFGFLNIKST